ncbi:MAG: HupE/UreJ family protein [Acidobacteriota bacterium]
MLGYLLLVLVAAVASAHGVGGRDQGFLTSAAGFAPGPFFYLGAKHMVTGYDHLLFLAGVIFFLYRFRDVATYVTLFAIGHSLTLLGGVLGGLNVDAYVIDASIGLSVSYKALENLGAFKTLGIEIDSRKAVFVFGLFHGLGLATKLQDLALSQDGLVGNMLAFNAGVELGQIAALSAILLAFNLWRSSGRFLRYAAVGNWLLLTAGFVLAGLQITGYVTS